MVKKAAVKKNPGVKKTRVHETHLQMVSGTSYKFYNIYVDAENGRYNVKSHWGRIGNKGSERTVQGYSHQGHAVNAAKRLAESKKDKGYLEVELSKETGTPIPISQKNKKASLARFADLLE